jgi:nitronate monooxygenase
MKETSLTARLGLRLPVVQGPFGGGLSTTRLVSTVSNLGGLGSFGAHVLPADALGGLVTELRGLTDAAFAVNLWVGDEDPGGNTADRDAILRARDQLAPFFEELGLPLPPVPEPPFQPRYADQIDALLEARPPVFSFVFGIPSRAVLEACRARDIATIGAATSVAEARALEDAGVTAIVATGFEAGGHRPSFLAAAEDSLMGTFALTQLVSQRVKVPVIAAGGVVDGRGVRAAMTLGASAAQLGTAFLACEESGASAVHRAALFGEGSAHTVLTRAFSGRLARGLSNRFTEAARAPGTPFAPYPLQSWLVSHLKAASIARGTTDFVSLWAGQIAPNLRFASARALMKSLEQEISE